VSPTIIFGFTNVLELGAQRLGEFGDLLQFTTGKLYLGADIPDSGLRQDMLNDSILLRYLSDI
jgi:hypothetical protein